MTTALGLLQSACYSLGITPPSSIFGTTDSGELKLREHLYNTCRKLRNMGGFVQQKRIHTFVLKDGRTRYPLPRNFYKLSGSTGYDQSQRLPLGGPVSDEEMQNRKFLYPNSGGPYSFRIIGSDSNPYTNGGQFELDFVPSESGAITSFEYVASDFFKPQDWLPSTAYTTVAPARVNANGSNFSCSTNGTSDLFPPFFYVDGDGNAIGGDNTCKWALVPAHSTTTFYNVGDFVNANSKIYQRTAAGVSSVGPSHTSGTTSSWAWISTPSAWAAGTAYTEDSSYVSSQSKYYRCVQSGYSNVNAINFTATAWGEKGATNAPIWTIIQAPYETVLADTDLCIFDDDVVIQGIIWHWENKATLETPSSYDEFVKYVNSARGRMQGSSRGSFCRGGYSPGPILPLRNWNIGD